MSAFKSGSILKRVFVCLAGIFSFSNIYAQSERADTLSFINYYVPRTNINSRLDKQLNTYSLNSGLHYSEYFGKLFLLVNENFISTLIKSTPKSIKDEQYFTFLTEYSIYTNLSAGIAFSNNILSDSRKIGLNQASIANSYLYLKYLPYDQIRIAAFGGYSNNNQIGEKDGGYIYGAEGTSGYMNLANMDFEAQGKFSNEDISPRKNTLRLFSVNTSNYLNENFQNILSANFQQSRKDYYNTADSLTSTEFDITNNIQSRIESNYFIQNRLSFKDPINPFSFDLMGRVVWRKIDRFTRYRSLNYVSRDIFDVDVREFRLEFESIGRYNSESFNSYFRMNFSERDEKHITKKFAESNIFFYEERQRAFEEKSRIESQKNNIADRISVLFSGSYLISKKDSLDFNFIHNKLTYDTPSDENYDDRDELLSIFRVSYSRFLTPFFTAFINLEGSVNHVVYIFSERSSNNNIRRIIKLGTGGNYHGKNLRSKNLFEVSANYTTYDFEDLNPNIRSFSFRQLSMVDSTDLKLLRNIYFNIYSYLKISEQGDFRWSSFSGKPTRDLEELYIEPKLMLRRNSISFGAGLRYLSLVTYFYKPQKIRESRYLSIGPLAEIIISLNQKLYLRTYGWYEFISDETDKKRELANFNMQVTWEF